jgi:hypothetical protein
MKIVKIETIDDRIEPKTTFYFENGETKTFIISETISDEKKYKEHQKYLFDFLFENFKYLYKKQPQKYKETKLYKYLSRYISEPLLTRLLLSTIPDTDTDKQRSEYIENCLYYWFLYA